MTCQAVAEAGPCVLWVCVLGEGGGGGLCLCSFLARLCVNVQHVVVSPCFVHPSSFYVLCVKVLLLHRARLVPQSFL